MNRPPAATIARTGGRLLAALLPLVALFIVRVTGAFPAGSFPGWFVAVVAGLGSAVAGGGLLLTVWAHIERGRARDLGDAAGLGLLAGTLAGVAAGAHQDGIGIGAAAGAAAFVVGSVLGGRRVKGRRLRWAGVTVATIVMEGGLAVALFGGSTATGPGAAPYLLAAAGVLAALAAGLTWREGTRATALAVAAASFATLALAGSADGGRIAGLAGVAAAAGSMDWLMARRRWGAPAADRAARPGSETPPEVRARLQAAVPPEVAEPEFDEAARLTRELRATLDDLVAARRTIGLQREEIERASTADQLTGLPGRGPTLERLNDEAAMARRYGHPLAVVLLDVDAFAELNHQHGLETGDAVLRELALRLRVRIREADLLGRAGGDSFLAILPHTDEGGAATFANALLDRLVRRPFSTPRGELQVAVSIGIALMRGGMTFSGEELLAAAEEALSSAKAAGGNRIAFDRLHGLARLDERRSDPMDDDPAGEASPDRLR